MKYHLIYNPTARSGRSRKDFDLIIKILREKKVDFDYTLTAKKDEAISLAQNITNDKSPVVVAVGGDGTMCEVITGLMRQPKDRQPVLGVLHIGTSPDFPRYHGIPTQAAAAAEFLLKAKPAEIDVGRVTYLDLSKKNQETSYFGCNVNVGLGPCIASKYGNRYRALLGDFSGTLLATLVSLAQHKRSKVVIETEAGRQELDDLINLTVGKDPFLASGMRIPVEINPDDGKLFYLALQSRSKIKLLGQLWRIYNGNILDFPGASFGRCKKMTISSNDLSSVEFDGDVRGNLPATIEIMPKAIRVLKKL
jgi:YegS/Rv2252/BmrU family lipid kinase